MYAPGDRVICGNCGRWRHEHYDRAGIFVADRIAKDPCFEYFGIEPSGQQLVGLLEDQLKAARAAVKAAGS